MLQQLSRVRDPDAQLISVRRQAITPLEFPQDLKSTEACLLRQGGQVALATVIGVKALANALGRSCRQAVRPAGARHLLDKLVQQRFDQVDERRLQLQGRVMLSDRPHQRRQPSCQVGRGLGSDGRPVGKPAAACLLGHVVTEDGGVDDERAERADAANAGRAVHFPRLRAERHSRPHLLPPAPVDHVAVPGPGDRHPVGGIEPTPLAGRVVSVENLHAGKIRPTAGNRSSRSRPALTSIFVTDDEIETHAIPRSTSRSIIASEWRIGHPGLTGAPCQRSYKSKTNRK